MVLFGAVLALLGRIHLLDTLHNGLDTLHDLIDIGLDLCVVSFFHIIDTLGNLRRIWVAMDQTTGWALPGVNTMVVNVVVVVVPIAIIFHDHRGGSGQMLRRLRILVS